MGKTEKQPLRQKLGRRSHKDAAPTADELALIALELFANAHYTLVSIKDIGRAANVNSAMIYYHFKDKEDLFRAAIGCAVQEAFDLVTKRKLPTVDRLYSSEDQVEGARAFAEKRKPHWQGR